MKSLSDYRLLCGGSWGLPPQGCRSAFRYGNEPDFRNYGIGFRVVVKRKKDAST